MTDHIKELAHDPDVLDISFFFFLFERENDVLDLSDSG